MAAGIGDAQQVALGVESMLRHIVGRVLDLGEPVGIVISVGCDFAVLVGHRGAAAAGIIAEAGGGLVRVGDGGQPVHGIVGKAGLVLQGIDRSRAVSVSVVLIGGHIILRIGDGC